MSLVDVPKFHNEGAQIPKHLQEANGAQRLFKVSRCNSAKGSSDLAFELDDLGSHNLFEIVQHKNVALAVFDILRYRLNLGKRYSMPRTERTVDFSIFCRLFQH